MLEVLLQDIFLVLVDFLSACDLLQLRLVCHALNMKTTAALSNGFMASRVSAAMVRKDKWKDIARSGEYAILPPSDRVAGK